MLSELFTNNPEILAAIIALTGFVLAGFVARHTDRWLMNLESYLRRRTPDRFEHVDFRVPRQTLRRAAYFGTLVIFLMFSLNILGISVVKVWLNLLLHYIPQLILAGLIIFSGYLLSVIVRSMVAGIMEVNSDHLLPRLAQSLIITATVFTGLAQLSIDISFIWHLLVILLVLFFGGLSLAFALGSRQLVENLLARRALDHYRVGDQVRLKGVQGRITEILTTAVVLHSDEGTITVPTALFADSEVLLLKEEGLDDDAG
jgi:hypothetical protein